MGYGSKDNPVPWLGPQAWIKEVHWVNKKSIIVIVPVVGGARSVEFPAGGNCVATAINAGQTVGWIGGAVIDYQRRAPEPEFTSDGPYDEAIGSGIRPSTAWYTAIKPKILNGRTAAPGDIDPNSTDPIRADEVTFEGMPELAPGETLHEVSPWTWVDIGLQIEEPTGPYVDYKVLGASGSYTRFRKGTNFQINSWAVPFIGPPLCYGTTIGDPGGSLGAIAATATWPGGYSVKHTFNIDFGGATFTYKKKTYKPIARWVRGPYKKEQMSGPASGFDLQLLCEIQKED